MLQNQHPQRRDLCRMIVRSLSILLIFSITWSLFSHTAIYAQSNSDEPIPPSTGLLTFSVNPQEDSITLTWSTVDEIGKWGYHLWRSTTDNRDDAAILTTTPILSHGSSESLYTFYDISVLQGLHYTYWVEALHSDGRSIEYGPITTQLVVPEVTLSAVSQTSEQIFLPLLFGN